MANGVRTGDPRGFNKGRSSKFREGSRVRQTPEEGCRTYQPKRCGNNNKVEDNSPKTLNDKNEFISNVLLWTPAHEYDGVGRAARNYLHQFCPDTECNLEDLPAAMDDGWWYAHLIEFVSYYSELFNRMLVNMRWYLPFTLIIIPIEYN